jgi:glutamate-1-semialdehyde aminotransferase/Ser/Thr protein kinase RdoA (MazF antagonist)
MMQQSIGIFDRNNHSTFTIDYKPVPDATRTLIQQVIADHFFPNARIFSVEQVDETEINSNNFKVSLLDEHGHECIVLLRRYNTLQDRARIERSLNLLKWCSAQKLCVPQPYTTTKAGLLAERDGVFFSCFPFLQARHFRGSTREITEAAQEIAQLHTALARYEQSALFENSKVQENEHARVTTYTPDHIKAFITRIQAKHVQQGVDDIDEYVESVAGFLETMFRDTSKRMQATHALPLQLTHSDLTPHNFLYAENDELRAIIDFDAVRIAERARDVSFAIYRLGRQLLAFTGEQRTLSDNEKQELVNNATTTFLTTYTHANPLTKEEQEHLATLMYDEICRKILFVLDNRYHKDDHRWDKEIYKFVTALKEIAYFERALDRRVLDRREIYTQINNQPETPLPLQVPASTPTRSLTQSDAYLEEAALYIPGKAQTMSKYPEQYVRGASPVALSHGKGCMVWDLDGNKYIDLCLGLGPMILGYGNERINNAVKQQIDKGTIFSLPHSKEVELARVLTKIIPCADMVKFFLNGGDATTAAVRLARGHTGKNHVAKCGYHGWLDWTIATKENRNLGVPAEVKALTHNFEYNNPDSLKQLFEQYPAQIGVVVMEPANVTMPSNNFLQKVKNIAHQHGALLVFDEIITGFRFALGGAQEYFGVTPDLACFGKAMANGFPISCVTGRSDVMASFTKVFASTTYGGYAPGIVAALETINIMQKEPVHKHIWQQGDRFIQQAQSILQQYTIPADIQGLGPHPVLNMRRENDQENRELLSVFIQEMALREVLTHSSILIGYSHKEEHIDQSLRAFEQSCKIMQAALHSGNIPSFLKGPVIAPRGRVHT